MGLKNGHHYGRLGPPGLCWGRGTTRSVGAPCWRRSRDPSVRRAKVMRRGLDLVLACKQQGKRSGGGRNSNGVAELGSWAKVEAVVEQQIASFPMRCGGLEERGLT